MNPLLNEIRTKAADRVKAIYNDIADAEKRIAQYREEQEPLIRLLQATSTKVPDDSGEVPVKALDPKAPTKTAVNVKVSTPSQKKTVVTAKPRTQFQKFWDRYSKKEFVYASEVRDWYLKELNPNSTNPRTGQSFASDATEFFVNQGRLARVSSGKYRVVRP